MVTTAMDTAQKIKLSTVCLTLICSNFTLAGDWQFDPSILVNETYTDNVGIVPNNEISSLVSQTGFSIESTYKAQHAIFNYQSQSNYEFYSHDHELDNDYHTLDSDLRLQLWPNGIIFVADIDISNQSRNASRNALADVVSADTVRVETYRGGFEYNINNSAFVINSGIGYFQTKSEDNIGDREGVIATLSSTNGSSARHIFWQVEHSYQKLKNNAQDGKLSQSEVKIGLITHFKINPFVRYYDEDNSGNLSNQNNSTESNSYGLGIRWLISPRLYLDSSYNKPIGNSLDIDGKKQDDYINTAIQWQPSIRTTLEANYSERFFGDSYGLNFIHKNKRLTNTISYVEDIQTLTRNNFVNNIIGFYLCPNNTTLIEQCIIQDDSSVIPANPSDPNDQGYRIFPIQDFTLVEDNVLSLNKTLNWNSTLELTRTTINFNASQQNRDNLETRIEDELNAISLNVKRDVSGRSSVSVDVSYTETNLQIDTELERVDRYRRYQLSYEKSLNSALSFSLTMSYLDRSSDSAELNYEEGRISAIFTKGF
jgi:uncharacterized protein (PEP-CTERM system associated)